MTTTQDIRDLFALIHIIDPYSNLEHLLFQREAGFQGPVVIYS